MHSFDVFYWCSKHHFAYIYFAFVYLFKQTRFDAIGNSLFPDQIERKEKLKTVFDEFKKLS